MICAACSTAAKNLSPHTDCPGKTQCDCQHLGAPPFQHANGDPCHGCQSCITVNDEESE